jgi:hypothetical protein
MERIIVSVLTILIVALLGVTLQKLIVKDGHYWIFAVAPPLILWAGWMVGTERDREDYRKLGRWLTAKLGLRSPGPRNPE